jgi:hypothetical protein
MIVGVWGLSSFKLAERLIRTKCLPPDSHYTFVSVIGMLFHSFSVISFPMFLHLFPSLSTAPHSAGEM